jgi:hypothetical protein
VPKVHGQSIDSISDWCLFEVCFFGAWSFSSARLRAIKVIRQDYIIRMIEKCAQMLSSIIARTKEGDLGQSRELIQQSSEELLGLSIEEIRDASDNVVVSRMMKGVSGAEGRNRCFMLVALLHQSARVHDQAGEDPEAGRCRLKALSLLMAIRNFTGEDVVPEFVPRVDILLAELATFELPPPLLVALMQHYETGGQFAKAEDRLFQLLDRVGYQPKTLEFAHSFFQRLLAKTDEDLLTGNLPRVEIESAIEELHNRE